mmetsp:Transcript_3134/g.9127  ORF Transcript_3134/g.9127 Transcript_3134/m.9127 type:complete len:227 (-) Transcript_3134:2601-3281(-)
MVGGSAAALAGLARALTLRFGLPPVVHWLTWLAKRSEQRVSWLLFASGPTLTAISVFPCPLKHGSMRCVNFEFRKGMCCRPSALAMNTSTKLDKLRLMLCVSLSLSPTAPDRSRRSEPAKSTKWRAPLNSWLRSGFEPDKYSAKMECDREDTEFMSVLPTARKVAALSINELICSIDDTWMLVMFVTTVPQSTSCLIVWHCGVEAGAAPPLFPEGSTRKRSRRTSL